MARSSSASRRRSGFLKTSCSVWSCRTSGLIRFRLQPGFVWDVAGPANPDNGHCFVGVGYTDIGVVIDSWGMLGTITWAAIAAYATTTGSANCTPCSLRRSSPRRSRKLQTATNGPRCKRILKHSKESNVKMFISLLFVVLLLAATAAAPARAGQYMNVNCANLMQIIENMALSDCASMPGPYARSTNWSSFSRRATTR